MNNYSFLCIRLKRKQKGFDMNKFIIILITLLTLTTATKAMSYSQAREQALFLTDKMAYELNLNEEQYDAAYEVNLDYLMSINTYDDLYGTYWTQRNLDFSYILLDWQYRAFCAATYFYRPLYWTSGVWHFAIYARYPRRDYFYFSRPTVYISYRGGHSWHHNGGCSWYKGRTFNHGSINRGHGMRDRFDRGDYGRGHKGAFSGRDRDNRRPRENGWGRNFNRRPENIKTIQNVKGNINGSNLKGQKSFRRNNRESSTRTTARPRPNGNGSMNFNGNRRQGISRQIKTPNNTFSPQRSTKSFSGNRSTPTRSFKSSGSSSRKSSSGGNSGRHFGGRR